MSAVTDHPLTAAQKRVLGRLLVQTLDGKITGRTRKEVCGMLSKDFPEPFHHLVSWTQGSSQSNAELTKSMLEELQIICKEVKEKLI